jgi:two-component system NtrC family response regulator
MTPTSDKPRESPKLKILFADDEVPLQELIRVELPRRGYDVTVCPDGLTALAALERNTYDCILVDLDMPGMNGIEVIAKAKELDPSCEAVILTGKSSLDSAIAALRCGAFDYLLKPCRLADLDALFTRVGRSLQLRRRCRALELRLEKLEGNSEMIGSHPSMVDLSALIRKVAPTPSTVLILGETGTGKELAARAIHAHSLRGDRSFVAINCAALPENLIESELFGHRKGAFTGADQNRTGLFEVADGGTLFLDEIGELPKTMQSKLLRVLESGEIRPVGDHRAFEVDVRVIAATHRDLAAMVRDGHFREDLFYRINTFEIILPPLRQRASDIPLLAKHLLLRMRSDASKNVEPISPAALQRLCAHDWPGNIRELANVLERASILCERLPILPEHLPRIEHKPSGGNESFDFAGKSLRDIEWLAIEASLQRHAGNKMAAAADLGISLKTLYNRLNQASESRKSA